MDAADLPPSEEEHGGGGELPHSSLQNWSRFPEDDDSTADCPRSDFELQFARLGRARSQNWREGEANDAHYAQLNRAGGERRQSNQKGFVRDSKMSSAELE